MRYFQAILYIAIVNKKSNLLTIYYNSKKITSIN